MLQESYRVAGNNNVYLPYDYLKYKTTIKLHYKFRCCKPYLVDNMRTYY